MQKRRIGNTGIEVSPIGLGTVKFGRNQGVKYPTAFVLPTDDEIDRLLQTAQSLGVNLLDTAPAYGTSEARIGKALKNKRHDWVLSTKVGESFIDGESFFDFSPKAIQASIAQSLKDLQTDYLDIVLVHSNGEDERIIREDAVFETLSKLKAQGLIRAYGMSTKTVLGGLLTIEQADIAMVTLNPLMLDDLPIIEAAHAKQKGIFIKKAFASGHLNQFKSTQPVSDVMRYIFSVPGVTSVIVGTLNPVHLEENVRAVPFPRFS